MMMTTGRRITTHEATVKTASITIKSLSLNAKQVTLAVFRQLDQEDLVDTDGTLRGVPWGRVNYHPDKCSDYREHLHIVWQTGDELRRAFVPKQPPNLEVEVYHEAERQRRIYKSRSWLDNRAESELATAEATIQELHGVVADIEASWRETYTALQALDLLFIAV